MKSLSIIFFILFLKTFSVFGKNNANLKKLPLPQTEENLLQKPNLKPGQFTAYFKGQYHIFETREFKKIILSKNCFNKKPVPNCQAYEISKIKVSDIIVKVPGQTNPASLHCSRMSGENLIAYDDQKNEYDYCRFSDNSLVSSWSMFQNAYVGAKK